MKKFLLSFGVIFVFVIYALHQNQEASSVQIIPPNKQANPVSVTATDTPTPAESSGTIPPTAQPTQQKSLYKDGTYTGDAQDAFYGNIQVQATIQNGKITDVQFLQYPNDRSESISINTQAMPYLKQEAIQAQSAQVDIISGATDSSQAFQQSLQSALDKAKNS